LLEDKKRVSAGVAESADVRVQMIHTLAPKYGVLTFIETRKIRKASGMWRRDKQPMNSFDANQQQ